MEENGFTDQVELQDTEEAETLEHLEKQIQHTDSLLATVVESLKHLASKVDALSSGKGNTKKHAIERHHLKESLQKGLEGLKVDETEAEGANAFIKVGSQVVPRRNALDAEYIEPIFLEMDEFDFENAPQLSAIVKNEPSAATSGSLVSTDERLEQLIEEPEDESSPNDLGEIASMLETSNKKHTRSTLQKGTAKILKDDLDHADKLASQLETIIRAKIPRSMDKKKGAAPQSASLLDIGTEDAKQTTPSDIDGVNLPSLESMRQKFSTILDNEPQY